MSGVVLAFSTRTPSTRRSWTWRTGQEVDTSPAGAATSEDIEVSFPDDLSACAKKGGLSPGQSPFLPQRLNAQVGQQIEKPLGKTGRQRRLGLQAHGGLGQAFLGRGNDSRVLPALESLSKIGCAV